MPKKDFLVAPKMQCSSTRLDVKICRSILVMILAAPLFASCSILGLKRQVVKLESQGTVAVEISPAPGASPPTYALAWTSVENGSTQSVGFQRVGSNGLAAFSLSLSNTYSVGAFTDENGNGKYDGSEPMALLRDVRPVPLGDPNVRGQLLKLNLSRDHGFSANTVIEIPKENPALGDSVAIALGEVTTLDDPRFASDSGEAGLWRPLDFLSQNQIGIYFTEPYDAQRVPVLFVYGIGGSVQDWRFLIEHFDRSHYQLWFYQYPSGMRLSKAAHALAAGLGLLRQRHGFERCCVIAHSMGGLVSGAAIREASPAGQTNFIPHFVSISTPWGGHAAAEAGIRHLSKPVPSWLDVRPESEFLHQLYANPLPRQTRHDLIYGEKSVKSRWLDGPNDGVVTVASELDSRMRRKAQSVTRFPREHVEILQQQETLDRVLECLRNP